MTERAVPDEGFLRRWARRKAEGRTAEAPVDEARRDAAPLPAAHGTASSVLAASAPVPGAAPSAHAASVSGDRTGVATRSAAPANAPPAPDARTSVAAGSAPSAPVPLPTLDDAAQLTADSDFSAFVARGVDAAVRRTALKKLFADPHFNAMDGLDVYIGDYTQPSPVSDAMLAQLAHARQVLRRAVDPGEDEDEGATAAETAHPQRQPSPEPGPDEHPPDRRLDDA